jgi:hypothetical protein
LNVFWLGFDEASRVTANAPVLMLIYTKKPRTGAPFVSKGASHSIVMKGDRSIVASPPDLVTYLGTRGALVTSYWTDSMSEYGLSPMMFSTFILYLQVMPGVRFDMV